MGGDSAVSLATVLSGGQAAFLALCTDTVRITRVATPSDPEYVERVIDEETMQYPEQGKVTVYEGPARLQVKADINSNVVETTAGEREWTYLTAQLQLPVHTPTGAIGDVKAVKVDDTAEILASPESPASVGRLFSIKGPYHKSHAVYLRFRVTEAV